jgi:membrane associated rhomboid family serine protease/Tfp pilus assembly protein PilF
MLSLHSENPTNEETRRVPGEFAVTNALLAVNIAVYVWMVLHHASPTSPGTDQIIRWGGNFGPLTLGTEPWRLLTALFVHIGIVHLLANMWALYVLGRLAETVYGHWTYLCVYLIAGLSGSVASLLWNPLGVSAGASGAIFGIAGALIATFIVGKLPLPKRNVRYLLFTLIVFSAFDLLYNIWRTGVDNAAHFGGFFTGILLGLLLGRYLGTERSARVIRERVLLAAMGAVLLFAVVIWKRDGYVADVERARQMLNQGKVNEAVALLQIAADKRPNETYILLLLADASVRKGDFSKAEALYRHVTQLKSNDALGWIGLAQSCAAEGKNAESAAAWVQAAGLAKTNSGAYWYNAGQAYSRTDKQTEAMQAFQKAIALEPYSPAAWGALGFAQLKAGQNQPAVTSLERAVKLQPGNADLRLILGNAYLAVGKQTEAQEQFFQASKIRAAILERMKKMKQQQQNTGAIKK